MSNKFNTFYNSATPVLTDHLVGYGDVGGTDTEKRWTITQLKALLESNLNITRLARDSDNYLNVSGSATGAGTVTLAPAGADANIDLVLSGLGTGTVVFSGSLTIAADLNLSGFDLITGGGDVTTGGGAINTGGGTLTLGAGGILSASGDITLTSGSIVLSAGDLTLSATGTLDINGGALLTNDIAVSSGANITCADNLIVGVALTNKIITTSGITGNKDAPGAGVEPPDLVLSGIVELDDEVFIRDKVYADSDLISETYIRGSQSVGLTADVTSVQGGGLISNEFNQYSTVGTAGDCATLPALSPEGYSATYRYPYMHIIVRNDDAVNAMDVFPNTGGTINGGAANAAVSVAAGAVTHFYGQVVGGNDVWFTA